MNKDWLDRWATGRTGWHEVAGNAGLKSFWPARDSASTTGGRVLVPLCGKTPDLLWLAERGYQVVGVELAEIAVRQFFVENNIDFTVERGPQLDRYQAKDCALTLYCGNYLDYSDEPFDALYDRGALVALSGSLRHVYLAHTRRLLRPGALKMIITLEYEQSIVQGPPFAVDADEVQAFCKDLRRVAVTNDIDNCPPKFRAAGLKEIHEVVWISP